ncbi:MAG: response regulator transcription factor [Faecalibacterium sp.]
MYNILICDDEVDIVNALKIYLTDANYCLFTAYNGQEAVDVVKSQDIHLVLMDIMMPVMDGICAMVKIREHSNVPVILLTAKSEDNDKILGLTVGADDYITKPFHPVEVATRVKSHLRRYMQLGGGAQNPSSFTAGGIVLDDVTKQVTLEGEQVTLTPKEYDILRFLLVHKGAVFTPKEIYAAVWEETASFGAESTVTVHIRHLREKLEVNPAQPRYLTVVWGQGYKIEKDI